MNRTSTQTSMLELTAGSCIHLKIKPTNSDNQSTWQRYKDCREVTPQLSCWELSPKLRFTIMRWRVFGTKMPKFA